MLLPDAPDWAGDLQHLDVLEEAALVAGADRRVHYANAAGERLLARLTSTETDQACLRDLVPDHVRGSFEEIVKHALAGTSWRGRLEVVAPDSGSVQTEVACVPARVGRQVVGVICLVDDPGPGGKSARAREARRLASRLASLAHVAAELGSAEDVGTVTDVVISQLSDAVGATVSSLSLVRDDHLVLAGLRGAAEGAEQRWRTYPLSSSTPAAEVARTGRPLFLVGSAAIQAAYPDLERAADGERSIVALPLRAGATTGAMTLSFAGRVELAGYEMEFLGTLADTCAQALERIRAQEEAATQQERARFLAQASAELSGSLDYSATLSNVARMAVPQFADWCGVDVLEDGRIRRVAVEHVDAAKVQLAIDLEDRYPSDRESGEGAWGAILSGQTVLMPQIPDDLIVEAAKDDEHLRLIRLLDLRSALVVPLVARDRVLGAISWVMAESGRSYSEEDVAFAEELARRAAVAIDNAQLHSQTREVAHELQRAALPDLPVVIDRWSLATFYAPAGRTEVGGDFFDVIPLDDGRLAVFVGDVMGRGVQAAAAMAQMRSAVRSYVAVDPDPETVLAKMDRLFASYDLAQLVTMVYLVLSPDSVVFANAGHLPPVVLHDDGTSELLPLADGPPLGAPATDRRARSAALPPGCTVVAFTDGLVERRGEDIDAGFARLRARLPALARDFSGAALEALAEEVRGDHLDDDLAVLAVRRA
ncbi:MAG TPA: SpoIIE family protein phosphatase [Nocardioides sp.]|nr:SpoIIE family protein phosphatase [Nocardioides sp.]